MGLLSTYPTIAGQHALTHQPGGEDVIIGIAPGAHAVTHILAGADPVIAGLDARALNLAAQGEIVFHAAAVNTLVALPVGVLGQALLSGGPAANVAWGAPATAAHEATHVAGGADDIDAALDARALGLTAQGEIVYHAAAANTLATLAVGAAGQALLSGGAAANVSWGAPAPAAHEATHVAGGADDIDAALDARALGLTAQGEIVYHAAAANTLATLAVGAAGQALLSGGAAANVSWGAPTPAAHVLATTGPHTNELPLTDLAAGAQGEIITRTGADWVALGVGALNQALLSGGAGANVSWGAPPTAAHATTHESGGADETRDMELDPGLADLDASGFKDLVVVGENVVAGDTLFLQNDGEYWKSDANGVGTMPIKVLVLDANIAADATGLVLRYGYYRNDGLYGWTPGAGEANLLYAHTTGGQIVQFANKPVGAGDQLQIVGHIVNANIIFFNPFYIMSELV